MYCPRCGQQQISEETRFCSRCGFLLTGVQELIDRDGILSKEPKAASARKRGLKQGAFLFFSGILLVPILAIVIVGILNFEGYLVGIVALLTFLGGILRMIFALLFESSDPAEKTLEENVFQTTQTLLNKKPGSKALPPEQSIPTSGYVPPNQGNWRDTKDLVEHGSVTEETTKLLEKEEKSEKH